LAQKLLVIISQINRKLPKWITPARIPHLPGRRVHEPEAFEGRAEDW